MRALEAGVPDGRVGAMVATWCRPRLPQGNGGLPTLAVYPGRKARAKPNQLIFCDGGGRRRRTKQIRFQMTCEQTEIRITVRYRPSQKAEVFSAAQQGKGSKGN